jgi:hypothetical protein
MSYVPAGGSPVGAMSGVGMLADWANARLYNLVEGNGVTAGIRQSNAYPSGDETLAAALASLAPVSYVLTNTGSAMALAYDGQMLFVDGPVSNSVVIDQVQAVDLSPSGQFGAASSDTTQSNTVRILMPYSFSPLRWNASDFVVACSQQGNVPGEICLLSTPSLGNQFLANTDASETRAVGGRGKIGSDATDGTVFVLGRKPSYPFPDPTPMGLYKISVGNAGPGFVKLGTLSPAQVDGTWTNFRGGCGVAYDQTDGNPIIMVTTTDAVANQNYVVKLDKTNASKIWACPVNAIDTYGDANMGRWQIVNQRIYYLGSGNQLYVINTSTGVAAVSTIGTLGLLAAQISEDDRGSVILYGTWNESTTHPTYVGTDMGTNGNHQKLSGTWLRFFPDGVSGPPPPPGGPGHRFLAESGPVRV